VSSNVGMLVLQSMVVGGGADGPIPLASVGRLVCICRTLGPVLQYCCCVIQFCTAVTLLYSAAPHCAVQHCTAVPLLHSAASDCAWLCECAALRCPAVYC
jgi:hypothetical protein